MPTKLDGVDEQIALLTARIEALEKELAEMKLNQLKTEEVKSICQEIQEEKAFIMGSLH